MRELIDEFDDGDDSLSPKQGTADTPEEDNMDMDEDDMEEEEDDDDDDRQDPEETRLLRTKYQEMITITNGMSCHVRDTFG